MPRKKVNSLPRFLERFLKSEIRVYNSEVPEVPENLSQKKEENGNYKGL